MQLDISHIFSNKIAMGKALCLLVICCCVALQDCRPPGDPMNKDETVQVYSGVQNMFGSIAADITDKGPTAWLRYFEDTPDFFMAVDGNLVFPSGDSARFFINQQLTKLICRIRLNWKQIRIDPLRSELAVVAASWHEDITYCTNNTVSEDGYLTALAEKTGRGWQLRNVHWSTAKK